MKINTQATPGTETIEEIPRPGAVFRAGNDFFIADDEDRYINLETGVVTEFSQMDVITILPNATLTPFGSSIKEILKDMKDQKTVPIYIKTLNDTIDMLEGLRMWVKNPKKKLTIHATHARIAAIDNLLEHLNMALKYEV